MTNNTTPAPDMPDKGKNQNSSGQKKQGAGLNPDLAVNEPKQGARPGDSYVRIEQKHKRLFHRIETGHLVATPGLLATSGAVGRGFRALKRVVIGRPLFSAEEVHERLTKVKALAVFGSDAISSSAYATEASLMVLMVAGNAALGVASWTALAIALLLVVVAFSYRQTVYAYPHGGGSYNVARQNLGRTFGLVAAAALLIDYVMTVAVSIAAGSAAVTSALIIAGQGSNVAFVNAHLPVFLNVNVLFSLFFIGIITLGNLRGIRESGTVFSIPTYLFIFSFGALLVVGLFKVFMGNLTPVGTPPILPTTQTLTIWLVLRAFSAGAVAMSGTEAISNGVPVFKKPESRNAATTITVMAVLLGVFFLGISFLATHMGLVPGQQTIISQVALAVFGKNGFYFGFQIVTMAILVVAANTAYADFPRLSSVLARDNFMPHTFLHRGDRLGFSSGILFLGGVAALLLIVFRGNVDSLIHLYAVGVFLAFSLSNSGMVVHWWRTREKGWKTSLLINGAGALVTTCILIVVAVTKFMLGAWIIIVLIPIIMMVFLAIHRHYAAVADQLRLTPEHLPPQKLEQFALVPIDDVNSASLRAMSFARTISKEIIVIHISTSPERAERVKQKMHDYAPDLKFVIVESPLRLLIQPLVAYVDALHEQRLNAFVTIVLPEFITAHRWERFLHNRTAEQLLQSLKKHSNVAVVSVPYHLEK
jgi:amino acid transporter